MTAGETILDSLSQGAKWYPNREAVIQGGQDERRSYTYAELDRASRAFGSGLAEREIGKGDRVVMLNRSTVEHTVAYFGVLRTGAIPATLHFREAESTIRKMVERITPTALVFQPRFRETADAIRDSCDCVEEFVAIDRRDSAPAYADSFTSLLEADARSLPENRGSDRAFINFSSGTTGVPKPVVHTHENVVESAHAGAFKKQIGPSTRTLKTNTPSFIAWANATFAVLNAGATIIYLEQSDPTDVLETIEAEDVTSLVLVPTVWKRVLGEDLTAYNLESVQRAGYAGEPLDPHLFSAIRDHFTDSICTMYGTTETMSSSMVLFPEHVTEETLDSVGYPVPNIEVRVIETGESDPQREVERGETGEVIIRGQSVSDEIWDDPELTRNTFHEDGWVFTGDLGYIDSNGLLYLQGRADNMIVSGGINVYPEAVSEILGYHSEIAEVAVLGVPHSRWGESLKAIVVPANEDLTEAELRDICENAPELASYQRPRTFEVVDELPRTGTNKLDYTALEAEYLE